jgi:hypothetical protein
VRYHFKTRQAQISILANSLTRTYTACRISRIWIRTRRTGCTYVTMQTQPIIRNVSFFFKRTSQTPQSCFPIQTLQSASIHISHLPMHVVAPVALEYVPAEQAVRRRISASGSMWDTISKLVKHRFQYFPTHLLVPTHVNQLVAFVAFE